MSHRKTNSTGQNVAQKNELNATNGAKCRTEKRTQCDMTKKKGRFK